MFSQVSVEAIIDSTQILVGNQTDMHVTANIRKGQKVSFKSWKPQEFIAPGLEVVEVPTIDTLDTGDGFLRITQHLRLTSFEDSLYYIPAQKVKVDGREYTSNNLALKVLTVQVDTLRPERYYGAADVQDNPFLWTEWESIVWLSVVAMAIYLMCVLAWLRLRSGKPIHLKVRIIKRIPPHQRALNTIDEIKEKAAAVDEKTYYTRLTDALRRYIEERFGFSAMEMTSAEIISRLNEENDREKITELAMLFETADLVKFAKHTVGISENDRNLVSAVEFINSTKLENLPVEEKVMPQVTEQEKQTMRMRLSLKWAIGIMIIVATALVAYVGWLMYDMRM